MAIDQIPIILIHIVTILITTITPTITKILIINLPQIQVQQLIDHLQVHLQQQDLRPQQQQQPLKDLKLTQHDLQTHLIRLVQEVAI